MVRTSLPGKATSTATSKGCAFAFGAVWILFWSAITLAFDGMLLYNGWRQIAALSYPTAPAEITHSQVKQGGGEADSTMLEVKYKFTVAGREFTGDKRRYNEGSSNDGWAENAVNEYPVGRKLTAYYNPRNPSDAVLNPGLLGEDLFMAMFFTPFNLIMLGGWAVAWSLRQRQPSSPTAGLKVLDDGSNIMVRLPETSPLIVAAIALGVAAFIMIFLVGFSVGFHASLNTMLIVWIILLGLAGIAYTKVAAPLWRGEMDLQLNLLDRTVTLPQSFGRVEPVAVPIDKITGISVEQQSRRAKMPTSTGPNAVTLHYRNDAGSTTGARLVEFSSKPRAEAFADWLRERLAQKQ